MDIMKTLLIYLSATMAFAVQSTSAPKETPTPSPEPVAVVETLAPDAEETGTVVESTAAPAETSAAAATQKPTPVPVPTITPNMKGYRNLAMGAKGKEVIKLQEKLIEMKYLPEGAADGAYGRQTYNAVKKFQYYNGLRADGIAGRSTQTNLFENPEAAPNPEVTAAPETAAYPGRRRRREHRKRTDGRAAGTAGPVHEGGGNRKGRRRYEDCRQADRGTERRRDGGAGGRNGRTG